MPRRVFITVAEVSGDAHAAEMVRELRRLDPLVRVDCVGGPRLAEVGANVVHESVGAAAMGLRGALRVVEVGRLIRRVRKRFQRQPPDLHVCVDSSAMNLPFARMARTAGVPVLYYIAPQLWASRERRMKKLRRYVDRVACILPFEEPYFRSHGVDAVYVGHPLFDELPEARSPASNARRAARFPDAPPVIGIIPGSRVGEVKSNLPHLLDVAAAIARQFHGARFLIPTTHAVDPIVAGLLISRDPQTFLRIPSGFDDAVPRCDLCLVKSGTSTLHVAAWNVPMIVVYRINPLVWHAMGRWLVKTRKIALVNILAGHVDLVPEFVPWYGSNRQVIDCALDLLQHPEKLTAQRAALRELIATLDHPGASRRTAELALEMMGVRSPEHEPVGSSQ
jgi:lipid-A-disaccharide synthase